MESDYYRDSDVYSHTTEKIQVETAYPYAAENVSPASSTPHLRTAPTSDTLPSHGDTLSSDRGTSIVTDDTPDYDCEYNQSTTARDS